MSYRDIEVPDAIIEDIRMYFGDKPEWNRLIEGTEASDEKIALAVRLYIDHFNNTPPVLRKTYGVEDFPSGLVLMQGAVIELLRMSGLIQSRNFLNFQDGGVSYTVNDKAQDYQGWIQNLMQTHREAAKQIKVAQNAEEGFGHIPSPEATYSHYDGAD